MAPPFYRDDAPGIWGYPTSTMDWCEENYAVTFAIAEFWNTISNVAIIAPPLLTIYRTNRESVLERRYVVCLVFLSIVGFGSLAFHTTLWYHSQLLDELPMVYGTCAMLYCIYEIDSEESKSGLWSSLFLAAISCAISFVYIVLKAPAVFLWSYGLLAALLFVLHIHGCVKYQGSAKLLIGSALCYCFGFLLWIIDNEMCFAVREIRSGLPLFFKPVSQLHAWWHAFAGFGTFCFSMFSLHLRLCVQGYEPVLRLVYNCIPYFVKGDRREECKTYNSLKTKQESRDL